MDTRTDLEEDRERREINQRMNSTGSERIHDRLSREYSELDLEVWKMTKSDSKEFVERLADEAEKAASRQDLKSLHQESTRC